MLSLWSDGQGSPLVFARRVDTIGETRARATIGDGKLDLDQVGMPVLANMCLVSFKLRCSSESTIRIARAGSEMEEIGAAFATNAFQNKPCMLT